MRALTITLGTLLAACAMMFLGGCGEDNPAGPSDPMLDMYGDYSGTLNLTLVDGTRTQDAMYLRLGEGKEVYLTLSGASYPTTVTSWSPTTVGLSVNLLGYEVGMVGTRRGDTISGSASMSIGSGTWAVSR